MSTASDGDVVGPDPAGYAEAVNELEAILEGLERDDVDVDRLAAQVARAGVLIRYCRDRITAARSAVDHAVADLADEPG